MRVAVTAGGTGGHLFPAISVIRALEARPELDAEVRFFGPDDRGERAMLEKQGITLEAVPAAPIRGRGPFKVARSLAQLVRGTFVALRKLRRFHPGVVVSTGGYASFPCSLAARILRKPLVVYLPDVSPGWAVRAEMRLATKVATTTDAALAFLPKAKTTVTGYPVRPEFFSLSRAQARTALGIADTDLVVVVAGASQGSQTINAAVFKDIRTILAVAKLYHITGAADYDDAAGFESQLGELAERYVPAPFRDDLPSIMLAADLAVMRAGASVLGELPAAGLPSILIPGTFAGAHQRENARWLAAAGAAVILEEADRARLGATIVALLEDEERLAAMRTAAASLARPDAADRIVDLILEVAKR